MIFKVVLKLEYSPLYPWHGWWVTNGGASFCSAMVLAHRSLKVSSSINGLPSHNCKKDPHCCLYYLGWFGWLAYLYPLIHTASLEQWVWPKVFAFSIKWFSMILGATLVECKSIWRLKGDRRFMCEGVYVHTLPSELSNLRVHSISTASFRAVENQKVFL